MSEFGHNRLAQVAAISMSAASLVAAAGCSMPSPEVTARVSPSSAPLDRCYDQVSPPMPDEAAPTLPPAPDPKDFPSSAAYQDAHNHWTDQYNNYQAAFNVYSQDAHPSLISLPLQSYGRVQGDPIKPSDDAQDTIRNATVRITNSKWSGSGTLTEDDKGNLFVLTAAHVVDQLPLNDYTVTDYKGKTSRVTGGCYIYESPTQLIPPEQEDPVPERDIAVIRLATRIGGKTVALASDAPHRGDWVFFGNYRKQPPPNIKEYTGVVALSQPSNEFVILNGLNTYDNSAQADALLHSDRTEPGASGGAAFTSKIEVTGVVSATTRPDSYMHLDEVKAKFNFEFPGAVEGPDTGFEPDATFVVPAYYGRLAEQSPKNATR